MDIIFVPLLSVLIRIIDLYQFLLIIYVIFSWLESFNVINRYNQFVYAMQGIFYRLYEPILMRIRRFLPDLGLDFSPLILLFSLYFAQGVLAKILQKFPM